MAQKKKTATKSDSAVGATVVMKDIKEVPIEPVEVIPEEPEDAPEKAAEVKPKKPAAKPDIVAAIPAKAVTEMGTAKATVTCQKFVGLWVTLQTGKLVTAPREAIRVLREKGLVE